MDDGLRRAKKSMTARDNGGRAATATTAAAASEERAHSDSGSLVHKCRNGDGPIEDTERGLAAGGAGASMEGRTRTDTRCKRERKSR